MNKPFPVIIIRLTFLVLLVNSVHAQTLLDLKSPYRYYAATGEPPSGWMLPEFDDSSWLPDTGNIGYGYDRTDVMIPAQTQALYIRYPLYLENPASIKEVNFTPDYDDGYILYLNGKEIIRRNVDSSLEFPPYNTLTTRSHESERKMRTPVYGYYIDSTILQQCNLAEENVVAIQVLNDSMNGSDLYCNMQVYKLNGESFNLYSGVRHRYKRQFTPDSFSLPVVIITTDEFGITDADERSKTFLQIIDRGNGKYNRLTDSSNVYYGSASMEVRGQSSSSFCKKSYRFELWDDQEQDTSVALLGMPADNDWVLYGPFQDKAQFRNPMVFDLARQFGRYQPRTRFCEVVLNGEYVGLYSLTETIKRSKERIDIAGLDRNDKTGIDVTGGYILKYDKPGGGLQIVYPKADTIQLEQELYVDMFMKGYNEIVRQLYFADPELGFRRYINDTSLVDHIIMNELTKNCDGYKYSTYFYKDRADRDNRIQYGTMWDNDLSFGNSLFQEGNLTFGWQFQYENFNLKVERMLQDTALANLFKKRWHMARSSFLSNENMFHYMDSTRQVLAEAIANNYYVWPVIDKDIFHSNYISQSYEEEIQNIKNWLTERTRWIDDNIDDLFFKVDTYNVAQDTNRFFEELSIDVYPNPFQEYISLRFELHEVSRVEIELFDLVGLIQLKKHDYVMDGRYELIWDDEQIRNLTSGIYILRVSINGKLERTVRLLKH